MGSKITRREFIIKTGLATGGLLVASQLPWLDEALAFLGPVDVGNPLAVYPDRDWEKVYRNQYAFDSTFTFVCVPNCTHNCRLRAVVRNGVVVRVEPTYEEGAYADLHGHTASPGWHPRGCLKGYTLPRRVYGPYRIKYPMVRKGWKEWVEAGYPDPAEPGNQKRYFRRGEDEWLRVSWDEAATLVAGTLLHVMKKYSGEKGAGILLKQGYPREMVEAMDGSGAQVIKMRGGMPLNGITRIMGFYRFANMLALYDGKHGARGWSNFDWHGDLPPGHPMVTGVKASDVDLNDLRHSKLIVFLGKNMVENKMADAHWWIEIMERGGKIVNVSPEYSPVSQKADYWIPVRPGTDTALLLGVVHILIRDRLWDPAFVKGYSDLPLLVRMDNLKRLRAKDLVPGYRHPELTGYSSKVQQIPPELREKWGDFVVWDVNTGAPSVITREDVGRHMWEQGIDPALEGSFEVTTVDGKTVKVKPAFQLYRELVAEYTPEVTSEITGAPPQLIERLARDIGTIKPAMIAHGEGVNHYFHCDLTTRAAWLPLVLTGNVGKPGANVTHWAGNYKGELFPGLPVYLAEDPFDQTLEANATAIKVKKYYKMEQPAYWNNNDRPLQVNGHTYTGKTHMPTPTKVKWIANANHLNNAKWAHQMIARVDRGVEMIVYQDWEWTGSCEHADVVFPVHSWLELNQPDMTAACSNPFLQVWKGGIKPLFDSKMDHEVLGLVASKLSKLTGDRRYRDYWKFVLEGHNEVYLQRILDASITTRGYRVGDLIKSDKGWLMLFRTYPRIFGWEQVHESKPFYNQTGRYEFYRDEDEFIEYGENLIVHREPVEATPYLPNVIVSSHPAIRPVNRVPLEATSAEERQVRNVKMGWKEARKTRNFLWEKGYRFYCLTPKSRHRVHSSWGVCDWNLIFESNYGDPYRSERRTPGVGEAQLHINPDDARELGINDGDYVYVDANPADRPYVGWATDDPYYKVSRCMVRARYNPAYPRGVVMMKHGYFIATPKSVEAHEGRADGRARSADTGYQANFRYGSQQSVTRGWLQPTMMTDSLVRKDYLGQKIGEGYEADVHAPNTCPKETLVRITRAESGGPDGEGIWEPARTGFTPGTESDSMQRYLGGRFVEIYGG